MGFNETTVGFMPTKNEIEEIVDRLITPENADADSRLLCDLVAAVVDVDGNREKRELADAAMRRAFLKTRAFEKAYLQYLGYEPLEKSAVSPAPVTEIKETQ